MFGNSGGFGFSVSFVDRASMFVEYVLSIPMYFRGKACSKNNSSLERVDSRVPSSQYTTIVYYYIVSYC